MKILILSDLNSSHTMKWVSALQARELQLVLFGLTDVYPQNRSNYSGINIYSGNIKKNFVHRGKNFSSKLIYIKTLSKLHAIIKEEKPDILHAHFASSYGTLAALSFFRPFVLSIWGTDVFEFPRRIVFLKWLFEFNLKRANRILSTSRIMAKEIRKYSEKKVDVIPFGINTDVFKPQATEPKQKQEVIVGMIKGLETIYGHEQFLRAIMNVKKRNPDKKIKVLIVGQGSQKLFLEELVRTLDIADITIFTGYVPYNQIVKYHNMIDIFVNPSIGPESFGVSVLEASACEKPVIASRIGGLSEVVFANKTGILVEPGNIDQLSVAIERLIINPSLRKQMGKDGRKWVKKHYNFVDNVEQLLGIYKSLL